MSQLNIFDEFPGNLSKGKIDLSTHSLVLYLSDDTPNLHDDKIKTDVTPIANGNGYTELVVNTAFAEATINSVSNTGIWQLTMANNIVIGTNGGSIGPFRYAVLCDANTTGNLLIGFWDANEEKLVVDGDNLTMSLPGEKIILQIGTANVMCNAALIECIPGGFLG
jgi:hypothetical protein